MWGEYWSMNGLVVLRKVTLFSLLTVILFGGIFFIALAVQANNERAQFTIRTNFNLSQLDSEDRFVAQKGDKLDWNFANKSLTLVREGVLIQTIDNPSDTAMHNFLGWSLSKKEINYKSWDVLVVQSLTLYAIWFENIQTFESLP